MNIQKWLSLAYVKLKESGVVSFQLDSLILLEHVTRLNKAYILAHQDEELSTKQILELNKLLTRRCKREPIAYITGKKEFYGREFYVNKNTLIPRPESESFIDLLKKHKVTHHNIIDVGCGSGVLGITTKLELPSNNIILSDVSKKALNIAKINLKRHDLNLPLLQADLLNLPESLNITDNNPTVVLANLPYVPKSLKTEPELNYEPKLALFAQNKGMKCYQLLWEQLLSASQISIVLTESMLSQHQEMNKLARNSEYELIDTIGLVQFFKRIMN